MDLCLRVGSSDISGGLIEYPLISFPEWASDHFFYERLVDGDPETMRIYANRVAEISPA